MMRGEFLRLDQFEIHRHVDGLRQQLLHAFFAQQLAKLEQSGGVAVAVVFKARLAREELPSGCLAPTLNHALVGVLWCSDLQCKVIDECEWRHGERAVNPC